jgi:glycosyltransferase involved in cell wall biosynthesis
MSPIDVSVLIPVYNNAATLDELLDRVVRVMESRGGAFEVVAVDDGSRDTSFAILERRAAADSRIRPHAMARNFGSQAATCAAFDLARGRRFVHIDADLELYPEDIPLLLDALDGGADFVVGYREDRQSPWLRRRLPSRLMNAYVKARTGFTIRDMGCGLGAAETRLVENLAAEGEGRRLLTPLLAGRARRVVEVPVRHRGKTGGSGHSFLTLLGMAADYYMLTAKRPFLVSGLVAASAVGVGILLLITGPRLAGLLLAGFGALGALASLIGEYAQRTYHLSQGLPFYKLRPSESDERRDLEPPLERRASGPRP